MTVELAANVPVASVVWEGVEASGTSFAATLGGGSHRIRATATLAGLAGTGQRYISELERGKSTARLGEMLKVLNALGAGLYIMSQDEAVEWIR